MNTVDTIQEIKEKWKAMTGEELHNLSIIYGRLPGRSKAASDAIKKLGTAINAVKNVKPSKTNPNDRKYKNRRKW